MDHRLFQIVLTNSFFKENSHDGLVTFGKRLENTPKIIFQYYYIDNHLKFFFL